MGKADAQRAWKKRKPPLEQALRTLGWQVTSKQWREGFVPNPATWINHGRWEDQPPEPKLPPARKDWKAPSAWTPAPWPEKGAK